MKTIPSALQDHLDGEATTLCHAWRVTRRDGAVLGFTEHDGDLQFAATTFQAASGFAASDIEAATGLAVTASEVTGAFSSDAINESDIRAGLYDGAAVEVFLVNWQDPSQYIKLDALEIGEVSLGGQAFQAELRSLTHRLDQPQGRIYSHRCDAVLGDSRCTVGIGSQNFSATATIASIQSASRLTLAGLDGWPRGFFRGGLMKFTSGKLDTIRVDIEDHASPNELTQIVCWLPLSQLPEIGDAVKIYAGCDKSFETCGKKFDNILNFQGFPHMPGSDFAYSYADGESEHDGGPLYE